jgi:hypothetical protein
MNFSYNIQSNGGVLALLEEVPFSPAVGLGFGSPTLVPFSEPRLEPTSFLGIGLQVEIKCIVKGVESISINVLKTNLGYARNILQFFYFAMNAEKYILRCSRCIVNVRLQTNNSFLGLIAIFQSGNLSTGMHFTHNCPL